MTPVPRARLKLPEKNSNILILCRCNWRYLPSITLWISIKLPGHSTHQVGQIAKSKSWNCVLWTKHLMDYPEARCLTLQDDRSLPRHLVFNPMAFACFLLALCLQCWTCRLRLVGWRLHGGCWLCSWSELLLLDTRQQPWSMVLASQTRDGQYTISYGLHEKTRLKQCPCQLHGKTRQKHCPGLFNIYMPKMWFYVCDVHVTNKVESCCVCYVLKTWGQYGSQKSCDKSEYQEGGIWNAFWASIFHPMAGI